MRIRAGWWNWPRTWREGPLPSRSPDASCSPRCERHFAGRETAERSCSRFERRAGACTPERAHFAAAEILLNSVLAALSERVRRPRLDRGERCPGGLGQLEAGLPADLSDRRRAALARLV